MNQQKHFSPKYSALQSLDVKNRPEVLKIEIQPGSADAKIGQWPQLTFAFVKVCASQMGNSEFWLWSLSFPGAQIPVYGGGLSGALGLRVILRRRNVEPFCRKQKIGYVRRISILRPDN